MKLSLLLSAALAATSANAYSYLRLAFSNLAVTNDPAAGEPVLSELVYTADQQFINLLHNHTERLSFVHSELVIQATNDGTPTPFLEIAVQNNLDQYWSFGVGSPNLNRGLVRNVGQGAFCLSALAEGNKLTMAECDASNILQMFEFGFFQPVVPAQKRGSSAAEVVARAVAERAAPADM